MRSQRHHLRLFAALFICVLVVSGCSNLKITSDPPAPTQTVTILPAATRTPTFTPLPTGTPTSTPTPTITPTPFWVFQPAGRIVCPILLYHRIDDPPSADSSSARYYVSPAEFDKQMQALHEWGYTTIPISRLVTAITTGAELPLRPVVITFDDGDISVYINAFPILQRYGFTGVIYLVANRMNIPGYLTYPKVNELTSAGWEVGSHGMSHVDLHQAHGSLMTEGYDSKKELEATLGVPVMTFAYPFGGFDDVVGDSIRSYGYYAGMGLGTSWNHFQTTLFYMSRIEIRNGTDLDGLASRLPWSGPLDASNTTTPTP